MASSQGERRCQVCERRRLAYSIKEIVDLTGLGRSLICEEIRTGRLQSLKIRGRRLILHVDLLDYLKGRAGKIEPDSPNSG